MPSLLKCFNQHPLIIIIQHHNNIIYVYREMVHWLKKKLIFTGLSDGGRDAVS
jgi:hypothetical protein